MVNPVNGANNGKAPDGFNKVTMYDEKSKKTKTFFVPVGQNLTVNGNTYDLDKAKGHEQVFKGNKEQAKFNLMGLALEHMDVNKDGKIDAKDSDPDLATSINKDLENSVYYVKQNYIFSDAGVHKGEGGVVFSVDGQGQFFEVGLEKKDKE